MIRYKLIMACAAFLLCAQSAHAYDYTTLNNGEKQEQQQKKKVWNKPKQRQSNTETKPQATAEQKNIKSYIKEYVQDVHQKCASAWKSKPCVVSLSALSRDLTIHYVDQLNKSNQNKFQDPLKENCAATTAALKQDVPAYAQKSAMTVCLNAISDISEASGVKPELDMYQIAVGSVGCLDKDGSCEEFEKQLNSVIQVK